MRRVAEKAPDEGTELLWICNAKELRRAGSVGTEIHDIINKVILGESVLETAFSKSVLAGYRLWKKTYGISIYYTDIFVYSEKLVFPFDFDLDMATVASLMLLGWIGMEISLWLILKLVKMSTISTLCNYRHTVKHWKSYANVKIPLVTLMYFILIRKRRSSISWE